MSLLSDEELAANLGDVTGCEAAVNADIGIGFETPHSDAIRAHIDALTAQRDRARNMVVALEQELAERDLQGVDNATGIRTLLATLQHLDDTGRRS